MRFSKSVNPAGSNRGVSTLCAPVTLWRTGLQRRVGESARVAAQKDPPARGSRFLQRQRL